MNKRYGVPRWIVQPILLFVFVLFSSPAHASDKLVVAFGDSLMAGYGLGPGEGFAPQLEASLRAGRVAARVHNAGVSGDTSAAGRARLGWVLTGLRAKPDIVIVELGANDMLRALPPAQTRANLDAIMTELKRRGIRVVLAGMLASPNLGPVYAREFNAIYPALARKHGATLYPFFMRGVAGNRSLLLRDGLHPTKRGVSIVVAGIAPTVRQVLRAR